MIVVKKTKLELDDVKLELSSLREIIKVLQEEIYEISQATQSAKNKCDKVYEGQETYNSSAIQEWTTLSTNRRRNLPRTNSNLRQLPLVTSNKFETLSNLKNENLPPECAPRVNCHKERRPPFRSVSKIKHVNQQIVIVGDSHARKSAAELKHCLHLTFAISSFVKPGAGMKDIVDPVKEDIKKLKHDDVVVIWGDSNDIRKNNSREALNICATS